jgi:hypothetical protein
MSDESEATVPIRTRVRSALLWKIATAVALVAGLSVAVWAWQSSRDGDSSTIAIQSPVATTVSWFAALNAHNKPLALAHFIFGDRDMMEWSFWGPPFKGLHCSQTSETATRADVYCTFDDVNDSDMSNVDFWTVSLQRSLSGPWLINNYGQG